MEVLKGFDSVRDKDACLGLETKAERDRGGIPSGRGGDGNVVVDNEGAADHAGCDMGGWNLGQGSHHMDKLADVVGTVGVGNMEDGGGVFTEPDALNWNY